MVAVLKKLISSFFDFIYPPLCLCCGESLFGGEPLFCRCCVGQLEVLDPAVRCPLCFSPDFDPDHSLCTDCSKTASALNRSLAVFDYVGPAASMVKRMKYGNQRHLAEGMAGYMAAQLLESGWEIPDYIIPVPITWLRQFDRGYNQSVLLAEGMGKILGCHVVEVVGRQCGDLCQAGLSRGQRLKLGADTFFLKKGKCCLREKNVLVIDDVMTTGTTLRRCAEVLAAEYPATIRAMAFCRAF